MVVLFAYLFYRQKANRISSETKMDQTRLLMGLAAIVIKSDGRIYPKELEIVERRLKRDFSPTMTERYMRDLKLCLKNRLRVEELGKAARHHFDINERYQVMHFLVSIVVSNGVLTDYEYETLRKIAINSGFNTTRLHATLAMFRFERISAHQNKKKEKTKTHTYRSGSALEKAFAILEIDTDATIDEIKSAYRKLAKIHHPDRVIHMGPEFQNGAKEKFQQLSNAYETIKKARNF